MFGVLDNSAAESRSAAFGASWLGERAYVGLGLSAFDTLYGIPGHHHEEEGIHADPAVRVDLDQRRVDLRGGWTELSDGIDGVNVRLGLNDYEHVELEGDDVGTRFANDAAELRLELLHAQVGRWMGALGAQFGDREFAAVGDEAFVPPVDSTTIGLFVVEDLELERWGVSLGARLETLEHELANGSPSYDGDATSFSFGGVRSFGEGYSFVTTLALTERVPVAEELYSDGPHLASGVVQVGDASLHNETAQHLDVGVRGEIGPVSWGITAFHTRYDDFIYLADSGDIDPVAEPPIFIYSQADAEFDGVETEIFVTLSSEGNTEVDVRLFADYVRGELATGESLPRLPPLRYGARFEYHSARLLVGLEATRYDDQDEIAPFETETPGYMLVNADVLWRLGDSTGMRLELFATATNLGDEEARKHTSFVKDIAPLPGRNYTLGLRSRF
jgi:iron complex outermembrane receptor protein